jgi:hypothetical protein
VEAIILGTPVVATRGAGHSEIIGAWGGGELANENDTAEEVAQLCLQTLAAPDRYRLTKGRREALAADLAPDAYADRILGLDQRLSRAPTLPSRPWVATQLASADANDSHDHRFQHRNCKREQDPR